MAGLDLLSNLPDGIESEIEKRNCSNPIDINRFLLAAPLISSLLASRITNLEEAYFRSVGQSSIVENSPSTLEGASNQRNSSHLLQRFQDHSHDCGIDLIYFAVKNLKILRVFLAGGAGGC